MCVCFTVYPKWDIQNDLQENGNQKKQVDHRLHSLKLLLSYWTIATSLHCFVFLGHTVCSQCCKYLLCDIFDRNTLKLWWKIIFSNSLVESSHLCIMQLTLAVWTPENMGVKWKVGHCATYTHLCPQCACSSTCGSTVRLFSSYKYRLILLDSEWVDFMSRKQTYEPLDWSSYCIVPLTIQIDWMDWI